MGSKKLLLKQKDWLELLTMVQGGVVPFDKALIMSDVAERKNGV